jgi:hypothetical protein
VSSFITRLISLLRPAIGSTTFYEGKMVTEVEWWISYVCKSPELYWGRLRVFSDGTADAAFDEETVYGFDDRRFAGYFLAEDEYTPFEALDGDDEVSIGASRSQLSPPMWKEQPSRFKYLGTY